MASQVYPGLKEFREHGLLWLINTSCLHPRGYALTFHLDKYGEVEGWSIQGDGKEPWMYGEECDDEFNAILNLLSQSGFRNLQMGTGLRMEFE